MTNEEIKAIVILLESTLGTMPTSVADNVVRGVIGLLKSKLPTTSSNVFLCGKNEM